MTQREAIGFGKRYADRLGVDVFYIWRGLAALWHYGQDLPVTQAWRAYRFRREGRRWLKDEI